MPPLPEVRRTGGTPVNVCVGVRCHRAGGTKVEWNEQVLLVSHLPPHPEKVN